MRSPASTTWLDGRFLINAVLDDVATAPITLVHWLAAATDRFQPSLGQNQ